MSNQEFWTELDKLRREGWCVVVKALPPQVPFWQQGSASEIAPERGGPIANTKDQWAVEISDMRHYYERGARYRAGIARFGDTPHEALSELLDHKRASERWEAAHGSGNP